MIGEVTSSDGARIAYERVGSGSPVVLIGGGLADRTEHVDLASALSPHHEVINYDRRGRGVSTDGPRYDVAREVDDVRALIAVVGSPVGLFGASSGGALALEAVAAGLPVGRLAVYEVPYVVDPAGVAAWAAYRAELVGLLARGRHGDALVAFMRLAGAPAAGIEAARRSEAWPELERLAPTLAYDAECLGEGTPPLDRLGRISCPTLVATAAHADPNLAGLVPGFFDSAADTVATAITTAERVQVETTEHVAGVDVADVLIPFFA